VEIGKGGDGDRRSGERVGGRRGGELGRVGGKGVGGESSGGGEWEEKAKSTLWRGGGRGVEGKKDRRNGKMKGGGGAIRGLGKGGQLPLYRELASMRNLRLHGKNRAF